jgi:Carboxypeptidase regulatory-like domain/TonB-dependent Receptor Plug Domain
MKKQFFTGVALAALAIPGTVFLASPAFAQETTATITGSVTQGGAPLAGAAVTVTHVPSGTRSSATTDASGSFSFPGVRAGGPFTVTVNDTQYQVTDIFTQAGQAFELPIEIAGDAGSTGGDIIVTASRLPRAGSVSQGPATVLNAEQIANVASVNRDIRDLSRRDPFARLDDTPGGGRAISFAGQNARYNKFSVDGVPITDNFGLNPDGLPSRRSPIPLDAIGQFQAKVAPYDVREGNFQGGAINIILKSGTNDFEGTAFFAYSDQSLTGKKTKPGPGIPTGTVTIPNFTYKNYGAQISGPIIPDKLFFMIAAERVRAPLPIAEGPTDNNGGSLIPGLTQAIVDNVTSIAQTRYNYATGGVLKTNGDKDDRLVARLDANLSDTQRLAVTYTYADDAINLVQNANTSTSTPGLGLASNAYIQGNKLQTAVIQLNTEISDEFSTEVRGFYKDYKRIQDPLLGRGFAQFTVCTAPTSDRTVVGAAASASINCPTGVPTVSFGPDISRQTNQLTSKTWGGIVQARLTRNDHDVRLFFDMQTTKIFNSFLQRSAGDYYFDSIADYQAGNAQRLRYGNAIPSNIADNAAASFAYQAYALGIQDTWKINSRLTLSYGARYDLYGGKSRAVLNPTYVARYGFANNAFISGRGVFQPRIGFDWKPADDISIRGGIGIFSGGTPDVYVSNSFSNTGVLTNAIDVQQLNNGTFSPAALAAGQGAAILTNVNGATIPAAANAFLNNATVSANAPTASLDPNFKIPSQWRGTLSVSATPELFGTTGWEFGLDGFISGVRRQVAFTDIRVRPTALLTPDGRTRYAPITAFTDTNNDILLVNSAVGRSYVGVARIRKRFDFGIDAGVSFAYQNIRDANPATSSVAGSNYAAGVALDANSQAYGTSNDEVKYSFKYDLTFQKALFGDYKTTLALFGETRIGRPYSFTFRDLGARSSVFGTTGAGTRYLLYVPTGISDPRVSYANATDAQLFDNYINYTGLSRYRGQIAPRNAFNSKWFTRIDLHFSQELPGFISDKSRFTLFADVENFTNLLNKNWGQIREYSFPYTVAPVQVQCLTAAVPTGTAPGAAVAANTTAACAQYRYTANQTAGGQFTDPTTTIYSRQSLYAIRVGVRFAF